MATRTTTVTRRYRNRNPETMGQSEQLCTPIGRNTPQMMDASKKRGRRGKLKANCDLYAEKMGKLKK